MHNNPHNTAYVDGQNLHMGTTKLEINAWQVDLRKFNQLPTELLNSPKIQKEKGSLGI
jgi:hypothetical protein